MNVYATTDDLTAWLTDLDLDLPANADGLLRSATMLVAVAANRDPYNDSPTGTDATILRDATTAQAAAWVTLGLAPAAAGLDEAPVKESKLGSGDVTYDTAGQSDARAKAASEIAPEAAAILQAGGLLALPVPVGADTCDPLVNYGLGGTGLVARSGSWWRNL